MITIRLADRADAAAISQLILPVADSQIASDFPSEGRDELLRGMTQQAVAGYLQQGYQYHLAYDGQSLCGVIGMRGYSHVYHLFVAKNMQQQGIGRLLWERAAAASLADLQLTEFTVYSSRIAEPFYYSLGFRRTGEAKTRKGVTAIPMRLITS